MADTKKPDTSEQPSSGISRRDIFHIIGSAPALAAVTAGAAVAQEHQHAKEAIPAQTTQFVRRVFNDHQWRTVHVLCDLIIPADDRSGSATAAGVPEFIDDWLAFRNKEDDNQNFAAQILGGLTWLDLESNRLFTKDFADASVDQQKQILDRIAWPHKVEAADRPWAAFFSKYRDLTVSGFFSSKMGVADLPYLGNVSVSHWIGCDPKVWAIVEQRMRTGYKGLGGEVPPLLT